jgi:hypothetical protein
MQAQSLSVGWSRLISIMSEENPSRSSRTLARGGLDAGHRRACKRSDRGRQAHKRREEDAPERSILSDVLVASSSVPAAELPKRGL